ncbi:MAG: hypothetical protein AAGN82_11235 [Myxococcota bacterium]
MSTVDTFSYRNHEPTVGWRLKELRAVRDASLASDVFDGHLWVFRRRFARTVAAAAGLATLVAGVVGTIGLFVFVEASHRGPERIGAFAWADAAAVAFLLALAMVVAAYAAARMLAARAFRRFILRAGGHRAIPAVELSVLERQSPVATMRAVVAQWERVSVTLPVVAVALLGPLTLHLPFVIDMADLDAFGPSFLEDFGTWVLLSSAIVGHAHLVFAIACYRQAVRLIDGAISPTRAAVVAVMWAVLAAAIPGIVLLALPPILTLVTGAVLGPVVFTRAQRTLDQERAASHAWGAASAS